MTAVMLDTLREERSQLEERLALVDAAIVAASGSRLSAFSSAMPIW